MNRSERIDLILAIATELSKEEWTLVDLTLRQFGLPWTDIWQGTPQDYVVEMVERAEDEVLVELAHHLGLDDVLVKVDGDDTGVDVEHLRQLLELEKALMIAVATGGPRINTVNDEYKERRLAIRAALGGAGIADPNPFADLWQWYGRWRDGSLETYQSRREYITSLYQPAFDILSRIETAGAVEVLEPTGWMRVDRCMATVDQAFRTASSEEQFQSVGHLCREAMISLAQAVYDPAEHPSVGGVAPSDTDAKRMLEAYIAAELPGSGNEEFRRYARSAYQLAAAVAHRRNAQFRDAALCAEATRAIINAIAIISGRRDQG